jgi:hypothetical protein
MESSCRYKDIAGRPGEGVHSVRFMGIAVFDTVGTILVVWALAKYMKWPFWPSLVVAFILGELAHWYFCVNSAVLSMLLGSTANRDRL